jgi:hypothetical protein
LSPGAPKRRLRIRRKRRGLAEDAGGEVVAEFGCCLVEAVTSVSLILGLVLVPALLLLR